MSVRFVMDPSGIRASKPGWDAYGSRAGLTLDIGLKAGRLLAHGAVALNYIKNKQDNPNGPPQTAEFVNRSEGTIYWPNRSQIPELIVQPFRGIIRVPWTEDNVERYMADIAIYTDHAYVAFRNIASAINNTVDSGLPSHAIYFLTNKPAFST